MDTTHLEQAQTRWAQLADRVQLIAAQCAARADIDWHSRAAEGFRHEIGEHSRRISAAGTCGGQVVDAYRAHIAAVAAVPDMDIGTMVRAGL